MASGDITVPGTGQSFSALLLDAVATGSTNNGVWVDCGEYRTGVVVITGAATTTVANVQGRNDATRPTNATAGGVIDTISAGTDKYIPVSVLPRWIKAAITATGTGTVTAALIARR